MLWTRKKKTATLTASGIAKAEKYFNVENLADGANMTLQHHINQAIKARGVMKRDVDYVVRDGEVIIVDEFTGRLMLGRRYNEGCTRPSRPRRGVTVARESRTLATITFQNYFRMYEKLSGMTGTAQTEAAEFEGDLRPAGGGGAHEQARGPHRLQRRGVQNRTGQVQRRYRADHRVP